jgi:hypothetical protein
VGILQIAIEVPDQVRLVHIDNGTVGLFLFQKPCELKIAVSGISDFQTTVFDECDERVLLRYYSDDIPHQSFNESLAVEPEGCPGENDLRSRWTRKNLE